MQRLVTLAAMLSLPACTHGLRGVVATSRVSLPARSSLAAPRIRSSSMRQGQEPRAPGGRGVYLTLALCWVAAHIAPFVLGVPPANAATPALPEGFEFAGKEGGGLGGLDDIQVHTAHAVHIVCAAELVHVRTHHGPAQIAALLVTLFSILPAPGMLPKFGQDGDDSERPPRALRRGDNGMTKRRAPPRGPRRK